MRVYVKFGYASVSVSHAWTDILAHHRDVDAAADVIVAQSSDGKVLSMFLTTLVFKYLLPTNVLFTKLWIRQHLI